MRQKKIDEAKQLSLQGSKHLEKNIFKWTPDHLAAAPLFNNSADCYKAAGEYDMAQTMYLKCADSNEKLDSYAASAVALMQAAKIAEFLNNFSGAADIYSRSSLAWGYYGDLTKAADSLVKAAKVLEDKDDEHSLTLYMKACDMLYSLDTPKDRLQGVPPQALDVFRDSFKFLLKMDKIDEAIVLGGRMVLLFQAFGSESSMSKMMISHM